MNRHVFPIGLVLLAALTSFGCASQPAARYVYQDNEFGVVGIPVNTYDGKRSYRDQAEELMTRHFPEGYEIVRAEEVAEGERILDVGRKTEFATEPNISALNQVIKLGKVDRTTSFEEKDKLQVRECRIIYKRKTHQGPGRPRQFATVTSLTPPLYIDPNEVMRRQICTEMLAKASAAAKKTGDPEVQKAAAPTTKSEPMPSTRAKSAFDLDW
jgi:hypothetical protein